MSELIVPKGQPISGDPEKKGWLFKWTNYLKGYQRRWFVLSKGVLSYYRYYLNSVNLFSLVIVYFIHLINNCKYMLTFLSIHVILRALKIYYQFVFVSILYFKSGQNSNS